MPRSDSKLRLRKLAPFPSAWLILFVCPHTASFFFFFSEIHLFLLRSYFDSVVKTPWFPTRRALPFSFLPSWKRHLMPLTRTWVACTTREGPAWQRLWLPWQLPRPWRKGMFGVLGPRFWQAQSKLIKCPDASTQLLRVFRPKIAWFICLFIILIRGLAFVP